MSDIIIFCKNVKKFLLKSSIYYILIQNKIGKSQKNNAVHLKTKKANDNVIILNKSNFYSLFDVFYENEKKF